MVQVAASTPRRVTRSSLARFAYTETPDSASKGKLQGSYEPSPDIEDGIPGMNPSSRLVRKRKRTMTATVPQNAPSPATRKMAKELDAAVKVEVESEHFATTSTGSAQPTKHRRKPARRITDPATERPAVKAPTGWEDMYAVVQSMRGEGGAASNAPVDTMGCERLALPTASPRDQRFQTLVALMLSSQTKDTVNAIAMHRLQTELPPHAPGAPPGLNLENILAVSPAHLNELIYAVGFHNNKTKYLQQAAAICRDAHGGDIPDTLEGLVSLPGVGPKMAHLCLSAAWGRTEGIGVDVHVHRITNLWRWHGTGGSKNPEDTRVKLESWLPRDRWREINTLLVGLGQTVCLPVGRRCGDCELGLKGLCPAAERKKVFEGRRLKETVALGSGEQSVIKIGSEMVVESEKELVVNEAVDDKMADDTVLIKQELQDKS